MRGTAGVLSNEASTETVVCGKCGQRYAIRIEAPLQDAELSRKQASFVADKLVWDHIQERKHQGTIELPSFENERSTVVAI
jgi:transcription elongation factor Elf1